MAYPVIMNRLTPVGMAVLDLEGLGREFLVRINVLSHRLKVDDSKSMTDCGVEPAVTWSSTTLNPVVQHEHPSVR